MRDKDSREQAGRPYAVPVYRLQLVQDGTAEMSALCGPADVARYLKDIAAADREHIVALFLDAKNRPIGRHLVGVGTVNAAPAGPGDVFKAALLANAVSLILIHNHPSGDLTPSKEDDDLTRRIARAGALLGIRLVDHVILAPDGNYFSYKDSRPDCIGAD